MDVAKEHIIRTIVKTAVIHYATGFSDRHIAEYSMDNGTINMKIHNVFIAALGTDIQFYSALCRSLDSSLGNMLEKMAIAIAEENYVVSQAVAGVLYQKQIDFIATLLAKYKTHEIRNPKISDYRNVCVDLQQQQAQQRRHESDYYLFDKEKQMHYLIELKIGGDLDNKKARSEKEALLEQYYILSNSLGSADNVKLFFATAYNRYGEGNEWHQARVRQFFAEDELLISKDFWNFVCKSDEGYDIVIDEYQKNAHFIVEALNSIKVKYLPEME